MNRSCNSILWRLRHWNHRFSELYDELRKEIDRE